MIVLISKVSMLIFLENWHLEPKEFSKIKIRSSVERKVFIIRRRMIYLKKHPKAKKSNLTRRLGVKKTKVYFFDIYSIFFVNHFSTSKKNSYPIEFSKFYLNNSYSNFDGNYSEKESSNWYLFWFNLYSWILKVLILR